MTARRRAARSARRPREANRREERRRSATSFASLLRGALRTYGRALPAIAVVTLAVQLPTQVLLGLALERRGVTSSFWQEEYRSLADLVIGSLVLPALYAVIYDATRGKGLADLPRTIAWAYGRGPFAWIWTWLGMFMTRFLVSFVVGAATLPTLVGAWGVSRAWPAIGQLLAAPERLAAAVTSEPQLFAPALLVVPLLALPLAVFLRYALAEQVVALERLDGFEALQRSRALTSGVRWRLLGWLALFELPYHALALVLPEAVAPLGVVADGAARACCLVLGTLTGAFLVQVFLARGGEARDERRPPAERTDPPG